MRNPFPLTDPGSANFAPPLSLQTPAQPLPSSSPLPISDSRYPDYWTSHPWSAQGDTCRRCYFCGNPGHSHLICPHLRKQLEHGRNIPHHPHTGYVLSYNTVKRRVRAQVHDVVADIPLPETIAPPVTTNVYLNANPPSLTLAPTIATQREWQWVMASQDYPQL